MNDTIYREDVLRIIDRKTVRGKLQVAREVLKLPSADVQPVVRWIPCSERLPDRSMKTLVTTEWGYETTVEVYYWDKDRKWGTITNNVIAWMPLPASYKGEDDEVN